MTTQPAPSERTLSDQIADQIRTQIHAGELGPGQRLVERRLAQEYGVSHIPIREALTSLAEDGLIERLPRRGARVATLTERDLEEISSLRTVLEQFVVERARQHLTPQREKRLRQVVASMVTAARQGDTHRMIECDQEFHTLLWEYADHQLLLTINSQLRGRISRFLIAATHGLTPDQRIIHAYTHRDLIDAIVSDDPTHAAQAMADHIAEAKQRIAATLTRDTD